MITSGDRSIPVFPGTLYRITGTGLLSASCKDSKYAWSAQKVHRRRKLRKLWFEEHAVQAVGGSSITDNNDDMCMTPQGYSTRAA